METIPRTKSTGVTWRHKLSTIDPVLKTILGDHALVKMYFYKLPLIGSLVGVAKRSLQIAKLCLSVTAFSSN